MLSTIFKPSIVCRFFSRAKEIPLLSFQDLQGLMKSTEVTIIDVREPSELSETGKIPDAVNIPIGQLKSSFQLPDGEFKNILMHAKSDLKAKSIVLHCAKGLRAMKGATILEDFGFKNVSVFPGGIKEWKDNNGKID